MRVNYDDIIVVQIKTTCKAKDEKLASKEIIELGACLLDVNTLRTKNAFSILVRPNQEITKFCTERTGLTLEDISSGVSFCEAISFLEDAYGNVGAMPWASYGSFAKHVIEKECSNKKIENPLSDRFLNIKSLFPIIFSLRQEVSLREAIRKLEIEIPEGKDSRDDALNAAIVLKETVRGPGSLGGRFITTYARRNKKNA